MTDATFAPPFVTERLVLRSIVESDRAAHAQLFSRLEVLRFLYTDLMDEEQMSAHFERRLAVGPPTEGEWRNFAVERDGVLLGEVGLTLVSSAHRCYEVGYVFSPEFAGLGFATEATRALIDVAFAQLGAHRVVARLDARNDASRRLLERLGLRREAHFRSNEFVKGEWTDELVYAVLDEEWPALSARGRARQ